MVEEKIRSKRDIVEEFLAEPAPREFTPGMCALIRNPIARFLYYFMFVWSLIFAAGCIFFLYIPHIRSDASVIVMAIVAAFFALMGGSFLAVSLLARRAIRCYREIFAYGELCSVRVEAVHMGWSRIGNETFCKVDVSLVLPGGASRSSFDYVNNFAVEYYLDCRDAGKEVRALYAPDYAKRCVLVDKLVLEKRFD